jgi:peptidase S46-like protein
MSTSTRLCAVFGFLLAMIGLTVIDPRLEADEGMWTFANPPVAQVRDTYGFSITQPWLDHLRLSSVRFDNGGSCSPTTTSRPTSSRSSQHRRRTTWLTDSSRGRRPKN